MTKGKTRGNACVSPRLYESQEVLSLLKLLSASTAFCDKPVSVLIGGYFRWGLWLRLESLFSVRVNRKTLSIALFSIYISELNL